MDAPSGGVGSGGETTFVFLASVYPLLSETFVYDQIQALRSAGLRIEIVSNRKRAPEETHPHMREEMRRVLYLCDVPKRQIAGAHLRLLFRHPWRYMKSLLALLLSGERKLRALAQFSGATVVLRRFAGRGPVHLHAHFLYGAAGVALWARRLGGAGYSLTIHGSELVFDNPPDLEAKLAGARAIVSISQFNARQIASRFPEVEAGRVSVIPMGVRVEQSEHCITPVGFKPGGPVRVLNVGRLSEHKDHRTLIEACALLAERGIDIRCTIVGRGTLQGRLESDIERRGLADRVELAGPKFHDEVLALYGCSDVFVLSSVIEGVPIVLMEAMLAGLPVIATDVGAVAELVEHERSGLLVPPSDPEAIAEAVRRLLGGEYDLEALRRRARTRVLEDFDIRKNTRRFERLLVGLGGSVIK